MQDSAPFDFSFTATTYIFRADGYSPRVLISCGFGERQKAEDIKIGSQMAPSLLEEHQEQRRQIRAQ